MKNFKWESTFTSNLQICFINSEKNALNFIRQLPTFKFLILKLNIRLKFLNANVGLQIKITGYLKYFTLFILHYYLTQVTLDSSEFLFVAQTICCL